MSEALRCGPTRFDGTAGVSLFRLLLCLACLLLPWLNPFAGGPSTSVGPWLFSAACAALVFTATRPAMPHPIAAAVLGGLGAWTIMRSGWAPDTLAVAAACLLVLMMAAVAASCTERSPLLRAIGSAWLLAALASTAAALLQYFGWADRLAPWVDAANIGEAFGNLRQRNQFATLTAIGMAVVLWLPPQTRKRWPAMLAMVWLALGNAATTSRTGLLQLLLLGAAAWFLPGPRRPRRHLWLAASLAYAVGAALLPWLLEVASGAASTPIWSRVAGSDACSSRLVLWSNVLHLIAQRPWIGWGWGELDFAHYTTLYPGPRFCDILDNAHDLPLHLAVELGIPAAALVCGTFLWAALRAQPWREADPARQLAWSVLLVIGVHSLLEYPLWYGPFQMALGLCIGLLWPARGPEVAPRSPGAWRAASVALGIAGIVAAGSSAWAYYRASQIYLPPESRAPAWRDDPLGRIGRPWLFREQVRFAELTLKPLTRDNAARIHEAALDLLHYSPEPRVIEKLLESSLILGRDEELPLQLARFRAAFPDAYSTWVHGRANVPTGQP